MRQQFKETVSRLAASDDRLVLLLGDISVYLFSDLANRHPGRIINAGICENTLVTMAAGMSSVGFHAIVHTIAPFITERSYEQIKLDVCYNRFGCTIVTCGGSFDYAWDGATHHCYTDLELMRMLPRMEVMQPGSKREFDVLLSSCYNNGNPSYIRIAADEHGLDLPVEFGKGVVVKEIKGAKLTIATAGPLLSNVAEACSNLPVNVIYFHTIKPLDKDLLKRFNDTDFIVIHDAYGLFEAINAASRVKVSYHGLPDDFCCYYGTLADVRRKMGLDTAGIRRYIENILIKG